MADLVTAWGAYGLVRDSLMQPAVSDGLRDGGITSLPGWEGRMPEEHMRPVIRPVPSINGIPSV